MSITGRWRWMPLVAALALFVAACGGAAADVGDSAAVGDVSTTVTEEHSEDEAEHSDDEAEHSDDEAEHSEDEAEHSEDEAAHEDETFVFGEPADAADADRVIEIDANDDFTFGPAEIAVTAGETITFVITNTGNLPHDFTLGDETTQDAHEAEMAEMAGMAADEMMGHDDANAVVIAAGETKELTWHFSEAGTIVMGCHQVGHYAAGMKGTIQVDA